MSATVVPAPHDPKIRQTIESALKSARNMGSSQFDLDHFLRYDRRLPLPSDFRIDIVLKAMRDEQLIIEAQNKRFYHPEFAPRG